MSEITAEQYQEAYNDWVKTYRPVKFVEYSADNLELMKKQDPRYVWTDHDTCENSKLSAGFHFFGDPPSCCWVTHGWHIVEVAHGDYYDDVDISAYLPCECYDSHQDEWNAECNKCDGEGHIQYYFD